MKRITILVTAILLILSVPLLAQDEQPRVYTTDRPLIYEGAQDLWPYSFLNEKGEPDGFNIELIRLILGILGIPYDINMKPRQEVFRDLKSGNADLSIGLTTGFHEDNGYYSQNSVTLFTQSCLSPKNKPANIHNFHDLASHKLYVNDSSLCHHLMVDYGWEQNAIPITNMAETILQMSTDEEGEMVWNTLSLKWMLRKFQIDNLEITPVNMPHGEYRFISNDERLIHQLDSIFSELSSSDQLIPLQNKWFYPEREEEEATPTWIWYVCCGIAFLLLVFIIYTITYQMQARSIMKENARNHRRLALIMETSDVRVWTYDISSQTFTWRNEFGQPSYVYSREEFAQRYSKEDFDCIDQAMDNLSHRILKPNGKEVQEEEITLTIRAKDAREDGDTEMHDFIIALSVLRRDKSGKPTILIGTKKDITEKRRKKQMADERAMRYWELFNIPMVGIMFFNKEGVLANINQKACKMYCCDRDEILERRMTFHELLGIDHLDINDADGLHASFIMDPALMPEEKRAHCACHVQGRLYNEFRLVTVYNENNELLGLFAICQDVTMKTRMQDNLTKAKRQLAELEAKELEYTTTINDFIHNTNIRLASYSPSTHALTIMKGNNKIQHQLTQTRIMTLVDAEIRHKVMQLVGKMDAQEDITIDADIKTSLHVSDMWLHLHIHLLPQIGKHGKVTEYIGILRDISKLKAIEQQLAQAEAKTQEVEEAKNKFVNNMMEEIKTPLHSVIRQVNALTPDKQPTADDKCTHTIVQNADMLTHIISNILNLSRLEAHMVEITKRPTDFAMLFTTFCQNGWEKHQTPGVNYIIENPYNQLVVDIDADHLQNIIAQVTLNAAQHTRHGTIRARYDYIGRRLMISIEDSGEGMTSEKLAELVRQLEIGRHTSSGLGLPICKELLRQMGGNLEINSEEGVGTTVWITLPCVATAIKRKKNI